MAVVASEGRPAMARAGDRATACVRGVRAGNRAGRYGMIDGGKARGPLPVTKVVVRTREAARGYE
jgi:hypothetical protein